MGGRTYYMILGVSDTETPRGIRSAYRDLARRLHPDVAGQQATRAFQDITEAYDVLSDPQRRRAYNDELRRAQSRDAPAVRPAPPKSDHLEQLNIEVLLTPDEGRSGCLLPIGVPVLRCCRQCGGSGWDWLFPCLACGQQGAIEDEDIVRVRIPPMTWSGSIFETPLHGLGIHGLYLRLHVFVEPEVTNDRR